MLYGKPPALPFGVSYNTVPCDMVRLLLRSWFETEKRFETAHQPCQILSTWEYPEGTEAPLLFNVASTSNKTPQRRLFLHVITSCLSNLLPASVVD